MTRLDTTFTGEHFRHWRTACGFSIRQAADFLKLPYSSVVAFEANNGAVRALHPLLRDYIRGMTALHVLSPAERATVDELCDFTSDDDWLRAAPVPSLRPQPQPRGFATMDPTRVRELAAKGGRMRQRGGPRPVSLGVRAAAGALGMSESAVRKLIRRGDLPASKVGSRVLISVRHLEELVERWRT